jgi:hypothetical protein
LTAFFTGIRPYSGISRKELASRTISIADLGYDFLGAGSIHLPKMMTYRQLIINLAQENRLALCLLASYPLKSSN